MKKLHTVCIFLFIMLFSESLFSQERKSEFISQMRLYGGLSHQHHNFFKKPFSYTGAETGIFFTRHFLFGLYGSTFVSVLETTIAENKTFLHMWQAGLTGGILTSDSTLAHGGFLIHTGYLSISGDLSRFSLFQTENPLIKLDGMVFVPQLFGEINFTMWMKIRTGIGYDFYLLKSRPHFDVSEIQNISINFAFVFGRFDRSKYLIARR